MRYFAVAVQTNEELFVTTRTFETVEKPSSFANAVMTTLMDQLDAMMDTTFASVKDDLIIENFAKKKTYPIWGDFDKMSVKKFEEHAGKTKIVAKAII